MSGRRTGIVAAQDGKTLKDEPLFYSSERSHLIVDPSKSKGHLQLLDMNGGIAMTVSTAVGEKKEYVFFKQAHGLSYIPKVTVRFYTRQVPAAMSGAEQQYSSFIFFGGIPFYEQIFFRVDGDYVYFVHEVGSITSSLIQSYTSIMQDILFTIKLTVFLNEGMDEPYESILQV